MAANQQALLMVSDGNTVSGPATCVADPYYSCGPTNDPYWANVVLMLHFDSDLVDEKGHTFSADGTTFTASGKFADAVDIGGTAVTGGGANVVYLDTATTDLWLDGGDFTIEGWCKNDATNNNRPRTLVRLSYGTSDYLAIGINEVSTDSWYFQYRTGVSTLTGATVGVPTPGQWFHLAYVRSGNTHYCIVNGVVLTTFTNSYRIAEQAISCFIGNSQRSFVDALCGQIDDLRITKGVARYTGNFNIPTVAFPDALETVWDPTDPRTVLSLHAEDATDSSCYQPKTVTLTGSASVSTTEKKFDLAAFSVANAGTSTLNGVVITDHMDLEFGTGDFTIEMWAYRTANTYYGTLFYGTYGGEFSLLVAPTTGRVTLNYYSSGGAQANIATNVTFLLTTWQHVVIQRRGTNFEFYLHGVLGNTTAITGGASSTVNSTGDFYLGRTNGSSALTWAGYIDEVRITKGVARYSPVSPFDVPALDFVPDASTKLLLRGDTDDDISADVRAISYSSGVTVGNAGPFVDGESWYAATVFGFPPTYRNISASVSGTPLQFGTTDVTIEAAFKVTPTGASDNAYLYNRAIQNVGAGGDFNIWCEGGTTWYVWFVSDGSSTFGFVSPNNSTTYQLTYTSTDVFDDAWHHFAVTRNGNYFSLWLDGILCGTRGLAVDFEAYASTQAVTINNRPAQNYSCQLYVSNYRISTIARYSILAFDPATLPNCDSAVAVAPPAIEGTSPLTGMSVTVRQQSIGSQEGFVALQSQAVTVSAWSPFADVTTQSKTVALTGRNITVSRGSLAVPRYPDLSSSNRSYFIITSPTTASLTVTFSPDGTWSAVDGEGATRFSGTWIDTAQTAYDIENISHLYRVLAVNIFVGYAPYYSYPTTPFTLSSDFVFVAQNLIYGTTVNFDFQVTIAPTSANPRYGEAYYYGTHRFNTAIELAG